MVESVGTVTEIETESFASSSSSSWLLELAASDNLASFKHAVELSAGMEGIDGTALWYCRQNGRMVLAQRTPVMIAALYGSYQVLKYILQCYLKAGIDINRSYSPDAVTALHCAASSGVQNSVEVVSLLLSFGADPGVLDAHGQRPADVVVMGSSKAGKKAALERLLLARAEMEESYLPSSESVFDVMSEYNNNNNTTATTALLAEVSSTPSSSPPDSPSLKDGFEKPREYPVDPYLPDIKNSVYSTDEFRMYSFKVRPCSRAYSHDWTECPFAHPGENARRRDPRRYHYSCVPCPDFRKGVCKRGDACEYAHGVFECWLHPAQYRTRLCKDGTNCGRRVCFFAHTTEELRPLYVSTGSAVPSPRGGGGGGGGGSSSALSPPMGPSSPSSVFMMSPFSQSNNNSNNNTSSGGGLATPPMSPSSSGQGGFTRQQLSSIPALHLPGAGLLQSSRLRTTLSARDMAIDEYARHHYHQNNLELDAHQLLLQDIQASMPPPQSRTSSISARVNKFRNLGLAVVPTNLDDAFLSESPRSVHESALLLNAHLQNHVVSESPRSIHESALLLNAHLQNQASIQRHSQFQAQINEELSRSPSHSASISSPRARFSSLVLDTSDLQMNNIITSTPPLSPAIAAALARHDRRSHSSRDLGSHLPLSDWGSPTGKPEWGINGDDLSKFRKSSSFQLSRPSDDEPALSWVQTLVKDCPTVVDPPNISANMEDNNNNAGPNGEGEQQVVDQSVLGSWIEQMHLDQLIAQGEAVNWSGSLCR